MTPAFVVREAREDDWRRIWPIIHDVIAEQQTFAGTAPGAFRHPHLGPVGLRIMWLDLRFPANATN